MFHHVGSTRDRFSPYSLCNGSYLTITIRCGHSSAAEPSSRGDSGPSFGERDSLWPVLDFGDATLTYGVIQYKFSNDISERRGCPLQSFIF